MRLPVLVAAWIGGLLLGLELDAYIPALVLLSVSGLVAAGLLRFLGWSPWPGLLAVVLIMGFLRAEMSQTPGIFEDIDALEEVTVRGQVASDPELSGPGVELVLDARSVDRGAGLEDAGGKLLVTARPPIELVRSREEPYFRYGDTPELTGRLQEPESFEDFDYPAYLARQGIYATMPFLSGCSCLLRVGATRLRPLCTTCGGSCPMAWT